MANELQYKPRSTARADLARPYVGYGAGAEWQGVQRAAEGIYKLANTLGNISNHLNEVEDNQNAVRMGTDIEIFMGQRITEYETVGADPDNYQRDVDRFFQETTQGVQKSYNFKTKEGQAAFNNRLQELKKFYTLKGMKRGMDLRIQRSVATYNDNLVGLQQAASMYETRDLAQGYLDVSLPDLQADAIKGGLVTEVDAHQQGYTIRNQTDFHYAQEQALGHPEKFIAAYDDNEKGFFKAYEYLAPNQYRDLLEKARVRQKANETARDKYKTERDKQAKNDYNTRLNELMVKVRDEPTTENIQTAYTHVHDGLKAGHLTESRGDDLTKVLQEAPFTTPSRVSASITLDIHSGKINDADDIWDYVKPGGLSPSDVKDKQEEWKKWTVERGGGVNRLDEAVKTFESEITFKLAGDDTPDNETKAEIRHKKEQFVNTLRGYCQAKNVPLYSPKVTIIAEKIKDKIVVDEGWLWNTTAPMYELYDLRKGKMPDKVYEYISPQFPDAEAGEIQAAYKWLWDNNYQITEETMRMGIDYIRDTESEVVP